jgi:hypothetical protein
MLRRLILPAIFIIVVFSGCNLISKVVKDVPIQEQDKLEQQYAGKQAWTRSLLIDIGPAGVIDRDTEVKIIALDLHWTGSVLVDPPNHHRITHALNLERPITVAAVSEKMDKLFWFTKPENRYRMNLRKYGKKTAKAVFEHQLFKGMIREAALESWGYPDEMKGSDIAGQNQEQWIYKDTRRKDKKRYVYLVENAVSSWEE